MFVLLLVVILLAVGFVLWPFVRQAVPAFTGSAFTSDTGEELRLQQMALYEAIRELDFAYEAGQYSQEDYQRQRLHYEQQAAAVLQTLDQQQQTVASSSQAASPHQEVAGGRSRWLRLGLITGVLVLSGLGWGYWLHRATSGPPDVSALLASADAALERGNAADAWLQYGAILEQAPDNVTVLTKLSLLAQRAGQPAAGLRLIERVLQLQPRSPQAWQVKGFLHNTLGDHQQAIAAWETYLRLAPGDDPHRQPIETLVAQTRQRARAAQTTDTTPATATPTTISGTIRLGAKPSLPILAGAALFIIARADTGPPLAVKRIAEPRFPLDYTLGMEDVMLHSGAFTGEVNVSARLAASGRIGPPQSGDLVGHYAGNPVVIGTTGVDMTLKQQR